MLYGTERANERANERVDCNHIHLCPWEPVRLKQQAHPGKFRIRSKPGGQKVVCHLSKTTTVIASLTHTPVGDGIRHSQAMPRHDTFQLMRASVSVRERKKVKVFSPSRRPLKSFVQTQITLSHTHPSSSSSLRAIFHSGKEAPLTGHHDVRETQLDGAGRGAASACGDCRPGW